MRTQTVHGQPVQVSASSPVRRCSEPGRGPDARSGAATPQRTADQLGAGRAVRRRLERVPWISRAGCGRPCSCLIVMI
jgi:hypothetical protein